MPINYFLIAYRHLLKNLLFSIISILGLAFGIASFLLIISYASYEFSYDQINEYIDDIYRAESIFYKGGLKIDHWPNSTNGAGIALKESFPEVKDMTRINWHNSDRMVRYREMKFREHHVCFADSNFFTFFNPPAIVYGGHVLRCSATETRVQDSTLGLIPFVILVITKILSYKKTTGVPLNEYRSLKCVS